MCGLERPSDLCALIVGKLMGTPVIVGDNHWYWPNTLLARLYFPIARLIAKQGTLLSVTKKSAEFWAFSGVPIKKMRLMTPPDYVPRLEVSDVDINKAEKLKRNLGLENRKVILYFGRLIRKKGVEYLIKAFKKASKEYENLFLLIAGDGPERKRLEDLCVELDIHNVHFTGFVKHDGKNAYFYLCDIFVYPSVTLDIPEERPLGVCEAMSLGKPVIVTKAVGSVNELVFHGLNGYVVPEKDDEAIYEAIKRLLIDNELKTKIGKNAKRTIEMDFAYEKLFNRLSEVIEEGLSFKFR
jgi:glycosyltransferase involved in cell wall biosynthesis